MNTRNTKQKEIIYKSIVEDKSHPTINEIIDKINAKKDPPKTVHLNLFSGLEIWYSTIIPTATNNIVAVVATSGLPNSKTISATTKIETASISVIPPGIALDNTLGINFPRIRL